MINDEKFTLRFAGADDTAIVLEYIKRLAKYEKMEEQVVADEQSLSYWMFEKEKAESLIAEYDGNPIGFALFFHNFSTFLGRAGIYVEDIFIDEEYRGKGFGGAIIRRLSEIALERGCGRVEWRCLDWNKPSIDFYQSIGAESLDEWISFRLDESKILSLARGEVE